MQPAPAYPETRYEPPLTDLSDPEVRARLTPAAVSAFFKIMDEWGLRAADARCLLGGVSNGAYYALKKGPARPLDEDTLRRISYLTGVYEALHTLYAGDLAAAWMRRPNTNRIFAGRAPYQYLIKGGLPAFWTLRQLLDARRNGH